MTALIDTLFQLEKQLGIELDTLMPYAEADTLGGYHPEESQRKWGSGAIWEVEGKTLYALVRALKPQHILEIGSGTGCSTNHMAAALLANYVNPATAGHIVTIDRANTPYVAHELRAFIEVRNDDAINYLALQSDNSIDFLLEDADHSIPLCHAIGELAKTKLKPGGVLIAHDAAHFGVGADVKRGYDLAGLDFRVYLTDPSDCGWAVWQRPQEDVRIVWTSDTKETFEEVKARHQAESLIDTQPVLQAQEEPNAPSWTPATLSDGQNEMLNLDAKWQAQEEYPTDQRDVKPPTTKKTTAGKRKPKAKPAK